MGEKYVELFSRENRDSDDDDVWDDTALIVAYDRAVALAKEEVHRRMGQKSMNTENVSSSAQSSKLSKNKKNKSKDECTVDQSFLASSDGHIWKIGMPCKAVYHEDGQCYEAVIDNISVDDGLCLIRFLGYNNQQLTCADDLMKSDGRAAQKQQIHDSKYVQTANTDEETMEFNEPVVEKPKVKGAKTTQTNINIQLPFGGMMPPPPPSQFSGKLPSEEADALSSMLMSWYLNGFHTGYYMGLKQGKEKAAEESQ